jgi:S-adenosylmethionine:tRNA ribosyltransferase-isomerase
MRPARTYPQRRDDVRLLVVDPARRSLHETRTSRLADLLSAGDLLVVNDAATLPASLLGRDDLGRPVEARLAALADEPARASQPDPSPSFLAVLFGAGDWHQRTEDRPLPPVLPVGAGLRFGVSGALRAEITAISPLSPRLVRLRFPASDRGGDDVWARIYRQGRPVQYAYLAHELPLFAVQTVYAARPWAFEMPSAGRPLSWETMLALRRRGVAWASLTHAAGLSSTGDAALDAALPLPERFDIPAATVDAIAATHARGGRVIAVGTTVVRALEGATQLWGALRAGPGTTDLRIGPGFQPRVVDGLLSGTHAPGESHFDLMRAFASEEVLARAAAQAEAAGFSTHELGDTMLILPARAARTTAPGAVDQRPKKLRLGAGAFFMATLML